MSTPLLRALSLSVGWLADRRVPTPLRAPLFRAYARLFGADLSEVRPPLEAYPSLGAFFIRRLVDGARPFPNDTALLPSPVDGRVQAIDRVNAGTLLQAKGRSYPVRELLGPVGSDVELEDAWAWTIYLSPRDYHRIHSPVDAKLAEACWMDRARYSVDPKVVARRERVFVTNERCALRLETAAGPRLLVLVGALNVGRIRVVGVPPTTTGALATPRPFALGEELARFEMGSTIVWIEPAGGAEPLPDLSVGDAVRMGQPIGRTD